MWGVARSLNPPFHLALRAQDERPPFAKGVMVAGLGFPGTQNKRGDLASYVKQNSRSIFLIGDFTLAQGIQHLSLQRRIPKWRITSVA